MNRTPLLVRWTLAAAAIAAAAGCDSHPSARSVGRAKEAPQSGLPETTMTIGHKTFTLEIAASDAAHETGLMNRDSMPSDHGMIFVFTGESPRTFWMKHTRIPLDILYVDATGKVVSVHQMKPFDLSPVASRGAARYAIELNEGAATAAGVKDGDQLSLPPDVTGAKSDAR